MPSETPETFLEMLRRQWATASDGAALEPLKTPSEGAALSDTEQALVEIRAAALWMASQMPLDGPQKRVLTRATDYLSGRAIRRWQDVLWALQLAAAAPVSSEPGRSIS